MMKGDQGIGLDLTKNVDGGVSITRLKEMPAGVINPAASASPPVAPGDTIIGVNGQMCTSFNDVVKLIRAAPSGPLTLSLQRL
jgi:C-terminal processing protease CtpA/Prc